MTRALIRIALLHPVRAITLVLIAGLSISQSSSAAAEDLADLSLEELTRLEISTGKKSQRASDVAAAVFVVTQDDIRRSGATSIPQALRLVPGLQVAQIDGNKWAISARGFNSRFANRLLVLMDGRTLYTLTFGGVFWDAQDTLIKDIERIEVVRGPGGALWGANAFNGVINIITKHASQTNGVLLSGEAGSEQPWGASLRIGDTNGPLSWRVFAKGFERDGNRDMNDNDANDYWRQARIGGRADMAIDERNALQLSFEAHRGTSGTELWSFPSATAAPQAFDARDDYDGAFIAAEWSRTSESGARMSLRGFADHTDRDSVAFDERRETYDLEWQHILARYGRHSLMWGVGVRHTSDRTGPTAISLNPASAGIDFYSGFIQDEIAFSNDDLVFTLGGKVEHSDFIGTQFMPNVRARYNVTTSTVIWSAISTGVRSASRLERHVLVDRTIPSLPAGTPPYFLPAPIGIEIWGDPDFEPERQTAYELGWRQRVSQFLSLDLATYYNKYRDVRGVQLLPAVCAPSMTPVDQDPLCVFAANKIVVPLQFTNLLAGETWGGEAVVTLDPLPQWRLTGTYSLFRYAFPENAVMISGESVDFTAGSFGLDARHQWNLRSSLSLGVNWEWDVRVRHVDKLPSAGVDAYSELDTRIAWRPLPSLEIAIAGQNLLRSNHSEFVSDFFDVAPIAIERRVILQARWSFLK
jgi:iron complex outermembrane receptor protein